MKITKIDYNNKKTRYKNERDKLPIVIKKLFEYARNNGLIAGVTFVPDETNTTSKPLFYYTDPPERVRAIIKESDDQYTIIDTPEGSFAEGYFAKPKATKSIPDVDEICGPLIKNYNK